MTTGTKVALGLAGLAGLALLASRMGGSSSSSSGGNIRKGPSGAYTIGGLDLWGSDPTSQALLKAAAEHQSDPSTHQGDRILGYYQGFPVRDETQAAWLDAHVGSSLEGTWRRV